MKSILIVTEQFTIGGLETHICGEIIRLTENGVQVHLATGKTFDDSLLPGALASFSHSIPLGPASTPSELLIAINRLRQIIREQLIDCVHVHPFTSIIPSIAAAELEAIPIALTLHGPASLASYGPLYDFLIKDVILPKSELIVAVSPEVKRLLSNYAKAESVAYIPNAVSFVDSGSSTLGLNEANPHWLVVSRLDQFKIQGIIDFCVKAKVSGIPGILVVGDGPAKDDLLRELERQGLSGYVKLLGVSTQIDALIQRSSGVGGMGRVLLEGLASKKPVVLIGYDGVKGVVDKALLKLAAEENFSGRGLPTVSADDLSEQLKKIACSDISEVYAFAKESFNDSDTWAMFLDRMNSISQAKSSVIAGLYHSLLGFPIKGSVPYLFNLEVLDRLQALVSEGDYFEPRLSTAASFCRERIRLEGIGILNQAMLDRDEQIASLNQAIADRDGQVAELNDALAHANLEYQQIMSSNLMNMTKVFIATRRKIQFLMNLSRAFLNVLILQGPRMALAKSKNWLQKRNLKKNLDVSSMQMSNQDIYLLNRSAQNEYISKYIISGIKDIHLNVLGDKFSEAVASSRGILVLPIAYPLELTQRPDHILRCFFEAGYLCIMLQVDNDAPFFKEIAQNRYLTNVFAGVISEIARRKDVVLYITYPFFGYLLSHLPRAQCLYDVLDDLSVFSLNCDAMQADHDNLLRRASVVIFSSTELLKKNCPKVEGKYFLVQNGVWLSDFENFSESGAVLSRVEGEFVVGYHGAISELLNWNLLEKITELSNVRLVMIGPLVTFEGYPDYLLEARERVLASTKVTHIQLVPYAELKNYLSSFDAGLIPFIVSDKTNPVLPLKLFEYMAMKLPICATKTLSLMEYSDSIFVGSDFEILAEIEAMAASKTKTQVDYTSILSGADWGIQVAPVVASLDSMINDAKNSAKISVRKVDIININFFDWDGVTLYKGGAERYVYDLACLMLESGWSPRIIQNANHDFSLEFRGIPVVGVKTDSGGDLRIMSKKFQEVCRDSDLVIASPADLACGLLGAKVIGINHGIYWDHKFKRLESNNIAEYKNIFDALRVASRVVSVDTNFINWTRTYDYTLASKLTYVPNYFDSQVFQSSPKIFNEKIRVLYPRRLYEARGIFITLKAFDYLFSKYSDLELHLVGQADEEDGKVVSAFVEKHHDRVVWSEFDMDEMHKVYLKSHVVLVPTLYAEGTSLSCIEAMATNNAIIATNIGGLPNLVVDGFNGCLINPTTNDLIFAIESLLNDREQMRAMAARGLEMSKIFEKGNWVARWKKVVTEVLQ